MKRYQSKFRDNLGINKERKLLFSADSAGSTNSMESTWPFKSIIIFQIYILIQIQKTLFQIGVYRSGLCLLNTDLSIFT